MKRFASIVLLVMLIAGSALAQTTYTGTDTSWNNDDWNNAGNWDNGIPAGTTNAVIGASKKASVDGDIAPAYAGTVTIGAGASLHINNVGDLNALGAGVLLSAGSRLILVGDSYTVPVPITLLADAEMKLSESSGGHHTTKTFTTPIDGAYHLGLFTGNNNTYKFQVSNSFAGVTLNAGASRLDAEAAGSLGTGDVTMNNSATLRIYASDSMSDTGTLYLVGSGDTKLPSPYYKLYMNAGDTIGGLSVDGFAYPTGTYSRIGGGAIYEKGWIGGNGILTVQTPPVDSTPPAVTFAGIGEGGSTNELYASEGVNYTITFDEPHAPELTASDLENALGGMTVERFVAVTGTYHVLQYQVAVTPSGSSMQLRIKSGTAIDDLFGNTLITPIADNDTFTIEAMPTLKGDCEVWKPWANGRINPATGLQWANGDQFRLAFVTAGTTTNAESTNIGDYNAFVQGIAESSTKYEKLENATWKVIGSTASIDARDNTETNPGEDGTGVAIFLLDGSTKVVDSNSDLWDNSIDNRIAMDQEGASQSGDVAAGSEFNGTARGNGRVLGGSGEVPPKVSVGSIYSGWILNYNQSASGQFRFYALSDPLTVRAPGGTVLIIR